MVKELVKTPADGSLARGWLPRLRRDWFEGSVQKRILCATAGLGVLTVFVKLAAMSRDIMVAKTFGAGDAMDAFFLALAVNSYVVTLLMSSINYSIVPTFVRTREIEGRVSAQRVLSNVMTLGLAALAVFGLLAALGSGSILRFMVPGFGASKLHLTRILFLIMMPAVVLGGITSTGSAILNCEHRFFLAGITPIITPLVAIIVLLILPGRDPTREVGWLAGSLGLGALGEFLVIITRLSRAGFSLLPRWSGIDFATKEILGQCGWRVTAAMLMGGIPLIEQAMAARLGAGNVSLLNYSNKMIAAVMGIGATALQTVALPHFSRLLAVKNWAAVRSVLSRNTRLIAWCSLPPMALLMFYSEPIVRLLYERGHFSPDATVQVARLQAIYSLQIPFYILGFLYAALFVSLNASRIQAWANVANLVMSYVLNTVLTKRFGVDGIAIAAVMVSIGSITVLTIILKTKFKFLYTRGNSADCD